MAVHYAPQKKFHLLTRLLFVLFYLVLVSQNVYIQQQVDLGPSTYYYKHGLFRLYLHMVLKVTKILAFQVRYAHRKSFMWRFQVGSDVTYWVFGCLYLLLIYFGRVWVVYTLQENSFGGIMGIPTTAV